MSVGDRLARRWAWIVAGASAGALLVALAMQYLAGYEPCQLCIWERWPYLGVVLVLGVGLALKRLRVAFVLAAILLIGNAVFSGFHVGVEEGVFALPETCGASEQATSVEQLRAQLAAAPARCDQVAFAFLGISLAGWNGLYSLLLAFAAISALIAWFRVSR